MIWSIVGGLLILGLLYEAISRLRDRTLPRPGRLVDVGGYRLHIQEEGEGGPTVVVVLGAGCVGDTWAHVAHQVGRFTHIVVIDRAGMGASDDGPAPSPDRFVAEMRAALSAAGVPGPYVLVGHSLGGLIIRLWHGRHPADVAGLVFVDSSHEDTVTMPQVRTPLKVVAFLAYIMQALSLFGVVRLLSLVDAMPLYPEAKYFRKQVSQAEFRRFVASACRAFAGVAGAELRSVWALIAEVNKYLRKDGPQFGNLPVAVVCNPAWGDLWINWQKEIAARSTDSSHRIVELKGHNVQLTSPAVVVDAIQEVVQKVRGSARQAG